MSATPEAVTVRVTKHPNPRIEAMAEAGYEEWNRNLFGQPIWSEASAMVKTRWFRVIESALAAALLDKEARP